MLNKIKSLIQPLFEDGHLKLVEVSVTGSSSNQLINVLADTMEGIKMGEVNRLAKDIRNLLEMDELLAGLYRLEVSSPGADRPLKELWEFQKNINRNLKINYEEDAEPKSCTGQLISADENQIIIKDRKDKITILMNEITKAHVQLKW